MTNASVNPSGFGVLAAAAALQPAPTPLQVGRADGVSVTPASPRYSVVASAIQTVAITPSPPVFDGLAQLMSLLDGHDGLGPAELVLFEKLMVAHLRATKLSEIFLQFKSGVNRLYVVALTVRRAVVGRRQLTRRTEVAAGVVGPRFGGAGGAFRKKLKTLPTLAQRHEGMSVVPTKRRSKLSPSLRARLVTSTTLSKPNGVRHNMRLAAKRAGLPAGKCSDACTTSWATKQVGEPSLTRWARGS